MMHRLIDAMARRRWPLLAAPFVLGLGFLVAGSGEQGSWVVTAVMILVCMGLLAWLAVNLSGHDPDVETRAAEVAPDALSAALFARWLKRSKHFRFVGGLCGAIVSFPFVDGGLGPVVAGILAGIAVGGAAAEVHVLRRRSSTPRSADMSPRRWSSYVTRTDTVACALIAAVAVGLIALAGTGQLGDRSLFWSALLALVAVVSSIVMQWAVAIRHRPALSPGLRDADDGMRRLAATQGFARPAIAFALLMLSHGLGSLGNSYPVAAAVLVMWMLAVAWYVSSRQSRDNMQSLLAS